ncbi:TPA: hypothetical protein ACLRJ7_000441 [Neisseria meningitidis]|uniref:hypothetical protein n=1 Tax=Neisseria meningitidis TaxID=487 RepID=UPI000FCC4C50|nr:hypothetical protein [Neisseria meningitidis]MCG3357687.1 hypothetical protein [Neisseria meningitidis]MCL4976349.1 hypothetical protein [Neisseria meningitidis]MCL5713044.1 hypothetical protein [Neisseria meningitidis]MCL5844369.1 hypothetical protein [Neisseria meningitidis]MCL5924431.1 hypothetical protein [Neisseria meningitidis]
MPSETKFRRHQAIKSNPASSSSDKPHPHHRFADKYRQPASTALHHNHTAAYHPETPQDNNCRQPNSKTVRYREQAIRLATVGNPIVHKPVVKRFGIRFPVEEILRHLGKNRSFHCR